MSGAPRNTIVFGRTPALRGRDVGLMVPMLAAGRDGSNDKIVSIPAIPVAQRQWEHLHRARYPVYGRAAALGAHHHADSDRTMSRTLDMSLVRTRAGQHRGCATTVHRRKTHDLLHCAAIPRSTPRLPWWKQRTCTPDHGGPKVARYHRSTVYSIAQSYVRDRTVRSHLSTHCGRAR